MKCLEVQFLAAVPRNRLDILPYYARLVGTLHRYIPEVGNGIVSIVGSALYGLDHDLPSAISLKTTFVTCKRERTLSCESFAARSVASISDRLC